MKKINDLKEKLFTVTGGFASKTGDYAQITKLTMEIKTLETKLNSQYEKLGRIFYERIQSSAENIVVDTELKELGEKIASIEKKIEAKQNEIEEIKKKGPSEDDSSQES